MSSSSGSGRVRLNRTALTVDRSLPKRRRSFGVNANTPVNEMAPDSHRASMELKMTNKMNLTSPYCEDLRSSKSVKFKAFDSNHMNGSPEKSAKVNFQLASEEGPSEAGGFRKDTKGNVTLQQFSEPVLMDHSGEKYLKRSIKSPCCVTCCETKYSHPRNNIFNKVRPSKLCETHAKETNKPSSRKLNCKIAKCPIVKLCDIGNVCKIPADFSNAKCTLSGELKIKSIQCFKKDCRDPIHLEFNAGLCRSGKVCQKIHISRPKNCPAPSSIGHKPKDKPGVISGSLPVLTLIKARDRPLQHTDSQNWAVKRMKLSDGKTAGPAQNNKVLGVSDTAVSTNCTAESLSCTNLPNISCVVKRADCSVSMEVDKRMISVEGCGDGSLDEDVKIDPEFIGLFSCQRTVPYLVGARMSCARTFISWPFHRHNSSGKMRVKESGDGSVSGSSAKTENDSVNHASCSLSRMVCSKESSSVPAKDAASDIKVTRGTERGTEPGMAQERKGGTGRENFESMKLYKESNAKCSKSDLRDDHCVCRPNSHGETNGGNGICIAKEQVELRLQKTDGKWEQSPPKRRSGSAVGNESCLQQFACSLNAVTVSGRPHTMAAKDLAPFGLSQSKRPFVGQKQKSSLLASPRVRQPDSESSSDGDTSSLTSEERLFDHVEELCGGIMCEIRDTTVPSQGSPSPGFNSRDKPGSDNPIDLVKAYEQDAIVLDVIQDDPELFGNVLKDTEEEATADSESYLKAVTASPGNIPAMRKSPKISFGNKISLIKNIPNGFPELKREDQSCPLPVFNEANKTDTPDSNSAPSDSMMAVSLPAEKSKADSTQNGDCDWLWQDLDTSLLGKAKLKSEKGSPPFLTNVQSRVNDIQCGAMQSKQTENHVTQSVARENSSFADPVDRELYCKFFFSEHHSCSRNMCWYLHVPMDGDEKFCMDVVQRFSRLENSHLQRAAAVFVGYYQKCPPGNHFISQELKSLLSALFKKGIVKDLLAVLRPPAKFLLAVFDHVRLCGLRVATTDLLDVTSTGVEAGLVFTLDDFQYMQHCLELLQIPRQQMDIFLAIKHRAVRCDSWTWKADISTLATDVKRCKEQAEWAKLGSMFCGLCLSNRSLAELNTLSSCVVLALLKDSPPSAPLPYAQFVEAVCPGGSTNELIKSLLGRIGVSLMFKYYKTQQWKKGREILDLLDGLKINYSTLKSLFVNESGSSRCRIISMAAEVFLNSGSLEGALNTLKDSKWITSTTMWPCNEEDVQNRHTVLCQLAEGTSLKNMHGQTLEILTKLPGLLPSADTADVSQYSVIFSRHLKPCIEKQNLTVASNTVEFMFLKKISVDPSLLQSLIHKLGKQNLWLKARSLYKCAAFIGYYPPAQVNMYCRLLPIHHSLSEIEMTLAIEMFMASNSSDIQKASQFAPALQIVLKRKGNAVLANEKDYQAAGSRLLSAAQITNPKLVIKYATVNPCMEQVFTLDTLSACKWLTQNMTWATNVWLNP